jgi:hypothetical protein
MFGWLKKLDKKIDSYVEDKKIDVDQRVDYRLIELDKVLEDKLNELELSQKVQLSEHAAKLENHCNLSLELAKESYAQKNDQFDTFIEDACQRLKGEFEEECKTSNIKEELAKLFKEYVTDIVFTTKPFIISNEAELDNYVLRLIKTVAFSEITPIITKSKYTKSEFKVTAKAEANGLMIHDILELGAKLGSDMVFIDRVSDNGFDYENSDYTGKKINIHVIMNATYYKVLGDMVTGNIAPKGKTMLGNEEVILGVNSDLESVPNNEVFELELEDGDVRPQEVEEKDGLICLDTFKEEGE